MMRVPTVTGIWWAQKACPPYLILSGAVTHRYDEPAVARMQRSGIREKRTAPMVPGFHFASSRLL